MAQSLVFTVTYNKLNNLTSQQLCFAAMSNARGCINFSNIDIEMYV